MHTARLLGRPDRMAVVVLAVAAATTGCLGGFGGQSGPTAPQRLDQVIGQNEREVIDRWGRPDDVYDYADGARDATWEHGYWNEAWEEEWSCEITLEVDPAGTVVDWDLSYINDAANPCHDIMDGET